MKTIHRTCLSLTVVAAAFTVLPRLAAADRTWSGAGADAHWSTPDNWGGATLANNDNLIFTGGAQTLNSNNIVGLTPGWLRFANGNFDLRGNGITVSTTAAGVVTNLAGTNTIALNLTLPANKVWYVNAGSEVRIAGGVANSASANGLILLDGGGTIRITSTNFLTPRGLDFNNAAGTIVIDGGFVQHSSDGIRFKPAAGQVAETRILNHGTWRVGGGGNFRMGFAGAAAGSTSQMFLESGTLELYGANTTINVSEVAGATAVFTQSGGLVWGSGTGNNDLAIATLSGADGTYNLNGGVLWIRQVRQGDAGAAQAVFNFNGGTLKPKVSLATFFQGVQAAYVRSGGAIIDTTNLNITIAQDLQAPPSPAVSGGLTKLGDATLTLAGNNSYTGPTIVRAGTLALGPANFPASSPLVLSNGTTLQVDVTGGSAALATPALTLGNSTLSLSYGTLGGNPSSPAISDSAALGTTLNAQGNTIQINVAGTGWVVGQFPLIKHSGTIGGNGFSAFKLGSLPPGVLAQLVPNPGAGSIDLNITLVVNALTWYGDLNANWDINSTLNWRDPGSAAAAYKEYGMTQVAGDIVTFNDSLEPTLLNTTIALTAALRPAVVNVENNSYDYAFGGVGKLSGGTILNKSGFAALTLGTINDHTGGGNLTGGSVLIGADSALGKGTVALGGTALVAPVGGSYTLSNAFTGLASDPINFGVTNGNLTLAGSFMTTGANDAFLYGGNDLIVKSALSFSDTGGWDIYGSRLVIDGGSATNADDGLRLHSAGRQAELVIRNGGVYEFGRRSGSPNLRLGQDASDPGTNVLRMESGQLLLVNTFQSILVGDKTGSTGIVHQTGGDVLFRAASTTGGVVFGSQSGSYGEYHLEGGVLDTPRVGLTAGASGLFYFNGGTLRVATNTFASAFFDGVQAVVQAGGAIFDTASFDVTVTAALGDGGGGMTKQGLGVLTLSGANTYPGPTVVNAGTLVVAPAHAAPGTITVADNAALGVLSPAVDQSARIPNATIGRGGSAALEARFAGQTGNPTLPAGYITNLTLHGTVAVNLAAVGVTPGQFPLLGYGTLSGSGSLVTGHLPQGVVGHIVINPAKSTIDLVVEAVSPLLWTGATSGSWDLTTSNWIIGVNPVKYAHGDSVWFDDTAVNPLVSLATALSPGSVSVTNAALGYAFNGPGSLGGNMSLTKTGPGSLALNTANTFVGTVTAKAGTLSVGNASALGTTAGATVVEAGATFDLNGVNLALEPIVLQGSGVNGQGALINSGGGQNDALRNVTLTGDTVVGGAGLIGLRTTADTDPGLIANGYKLTKLGPGAFNINGGTTVAGLTHVWTADLGDVDIQEGTVSFQRRSMMGYSTNTITVASNATLGLFALSQELPAPVKIVHLNNGTIQGNGNSAAEGSTFAGPITMASGSNFLAALTGTTLRLTGPITGSGDLHNTSGGAATVALAGTNTYTGVTVVSSGTLVLDATGSITTSPEIQVGAGAVFDVSAVSPWTLGAGQTLSGAGTVNGVVLANGTVSPGASVGNLTFTADLTLAGSTLLEVSKDGGLTNDVVTTYGALTLGGALNMVLTGSTPLAVDDTFRVLSFLTAPTGDFSPVTLPPGYTWDTSQLKMDGSIRVTGVLLRPTIQTPAVVDGRLILAGTGGTPGNSYSWLSSTNVAAPLANWVTNLTGVFDGGGAFSNALPINAAEPQRNFILKTP